MAVVNKKITLDLLAKTPTIKVYAKRLDNCTRHLIITIKSGDEPYTIPKGCKILFQGTKPDNTHFCDDVVIDYDNNVIDATLTGQILAVTGRCKAEIEIDEQNGTITASTFNMDIVERALSPDVVKSTDEYRSIYQMLLEVRDEAGEMLGVTETCTNAAKEAEEAAQKTYDFSHCVPLNYIADNLITTTEEHVLSANQGKVLDTKKVDKIAGKGLSTEDFTSEDKIKFDSMQAGATHTVVVDNLESTDSSSALSAKQGNLLSKSILNKDGGANNYYDDRIPIEKSIEDVTFPNPLKKGDTCRTPFFTYFYTGTEWRQLYYDSMGKGVEMYGIEKPDGYLETLDYYVPTRIIGVTFSNDRRVAAGSTEIAFDKAQDGFNSETRYAKLEDGVIKIKVKGIYAISAVAYIQNCASITDVWHFSIWRSNVMVSENFAKSGRNTMGASAHAVCLCNVGDEISTFIDPENDHDLWDLSARYTNLQLYPIRLMTLNEV